MIIKNKDIAPDISFWLIEKKYEPVFIYSRGEKNKKKISRFL
jgi:hypothetical protein